MDVSRWSYALGEFQNAWLVDVGCILDGIGIADDDEAVFRVCSILSDISSILYDDSYLVLYCPRNAFDLFPSFLPLDSNDLL